MYGGARRWRLGRTKLADQGLLVVVGELLSYWLLRGRRGRCCEEEEPFAMERGVEEAKTNFFLM